MDYEPTEEEIEQALPTRGFKHFVKLMNAKRSDWDAILQQMTHEERDDLHRLLRPHFPDD